MNPHNFVDLLIYLGLKKHEIVFYSESNYSIVDFLLKTHQFRTLEIIWKMWNIGIHDLCGANLEKKCQCIRYVTKKYDVHVLTWLVQKGLLIHHTNVQVTDKK